MPISEASLKPARRNSFTSRTSHKTSPVTVVIADNQTTTRLGVHQLLEPLPDVAVVGEAASGHEAIELVSTLAPHVLILEMKLPDLSGVEVVQRIARMDNATRPLVLSAYDDAPYIRTLADDQVAGYLTKADTAAHLIEAVYGIARGEEGWVSPGITRRLLKLRKEREAARLLHLTSREREALTVLARGCNNDEIADTLCVSVGTVKNHLTNVYEKLGVASRSRAIARAHRLGIVETASA